MKLPVFLLCFWCMQLPVHAAIDIVLDFGVTAQADIDAFSEDFESAETFWESRLTGYRDSGYGAPGQIVIGIELSYIDGEKGILGQAGPTHGNFFGNFVEAAYGIMRFDTADLLSLVENSVLGMVIRHEMGHVLGFGSMWTFNGVYQPGSGQYTGAAGVAAFREEFNQPDATYVPVELDGGAGSADSHWNMGIDLGTNEVEDSRDDPGDSIVYTSMEGGEFFFNELMTGYLSGSAWLSNTTLQSFYDIGYTVIPEPATVALWMSLFCFLCKVSRDRKNNSNPICRFF